VEERFFSQVVYLGSHDYQAVEEINPADLGMEVWRRGKHASADMRGKESGERVGNGK